MKDGSQGEAEARAERGAHSPAPRILALSSRVAYGRVGLSIIEPALQTLGCEAIALPTVQLGLRPGLGREARAPIDPAALVDMIAALDEGGVLAGVDAVLTGYAPTAAHVAAMADAIRRVRAAEPGALVVCDPVLGDAGRLYLAPDAAEAIRSDLAPMADLITPNAFEMAWLAGEAHSDPERASSIAPRLSDLTRMAAAHPAPSVVVTSAPAMLRGHIGTLLVEPERVLMAEARAAPQAPNGTGDLLGGLLTAHLARGLDIEKALVRATSAVHGLALRSHRAGAPHLLIAEESGELLGPTTPVSLRRMAPPRA